MQIQKTFSLYTHVTAKSGKFFYLKCKYIEKLSLNTHMVSPNQAQIVTFNENTQKTVILHALYGQIRQKLLL